MNSFGTNFRISIFGESHGPQIGIVIDGELWNLAVDMNGKVFKIRGNISKEQVKNVEVKVKEWLTNSNKVMPRVTNRCVAMTFWEMKGN